ncbi:hypothetical protein VKT23_012436 [Stygiomarasmius scandens]|uniref:Uncharacterized protein n=1 Tax=Marasmiellus scandens TaxID=2682957 RepID=A0ABR1JA42_9AGAR
MNTTTATENTITIPTLILSPPQALKTDNTILTPEEPLPIPPPIFQNPKTTQISNDNHNLYSSEPDDLTTQELIDSIQSLSNAIKKLDEK